MAGIRKFHDYLYGRHFELVTDHQPLLGLLAGNRQSPIVLSPRMSRWLVFLANYNYTLRYKPGRHIAHADALSRCPLAELLSDPAPACEVLAVEEGPLLVDALEVARESARDRGLARIKQWVLRGWPQSSPGEDFDAFFRCRSEFSLEKGCLLRGSRVVVPPSLCDRVLSLLHRGHPGIVRMKALARDYVWWPGMDKEIEQRVASCRACQDSRPFPPRAEPLLWEPPAGPWVRLHLDLAGPFMGQNFLIVVDAHSKWLEVVRLKSTQSQAIIMVLESLFASHGFPDLVVSDNGPQFTSVEFESFLGGVGIRHALTSPWHPASNGQAERMVRSTKDALKRMPEGSWHHRLTELLLAQHSTPCVSTGKTPAELLMGRKIRISLDRLHPLYSQAAQWPDRPGRKIGIGDSVFVRSYAGGLNWERATVRRELGPRSYETELMDGRVWRRHLDQIRLNKAEVKESDGGEKRTERLEGGVVQAPNIAPRALSPGKERPAAEVSPESTYRDPVPDLIPEDEWVPRRSGRICKKPAYLQDYVCSNQGERSEVSA